MGARRFGTRRVALAACLPLLVSFVAPFQWILLSGLAPAPLIGLLAAVQVERGRGYGETLIAASLPGGLLALFLLFGLRGESWERGDFVEGVTRSLEEVAAGAQLPDTEQLTQLIELTLKLLPGMAFVSLLLVAVLGYRVAQGVGERIGQPLPPAAPVRCWRLWESFIWALIASLAGLLVGGGLVRDLAINVALVLGLLYAAQGLALIRHLMWRLGVQRFLEVLVYMLLAFTSGLSLMFLVLLGLGDTWFDWRRIGHRKDEPPPANGGPDQEIDT
ncbi:MAG: DUF2232 domain-containing protein [Candidatus Latescibacteria bacterium]|nr:DUF2232 domain-containing protein [Candidatus Latescibacterota bacterium]MDP7447612.1 DUF2232 domain-containing protein [Candidatus Latescibacterota bacterium]HJP33420.1 DUF2232 domain-containing protein [Candidatus Latescibacterota bacterium]